MKIRLWKKVKAAAKYRAHIDAMSCTTNCFGTITRRSVSIGYGIANEMKDYRGLYFSGMSEDEFDRAVLSRYWELHKDEYYAKYRKRKKNERSVVNER